MNSYVPIFTPVRAPGILNDPILPPGPAGFVETPAYQRHRVVGALMPLVPVGREYAGIFVKNTV